MKLKRKLIATLALAFALTLTFVSSAAAAVSFESFSTASSPGGGTIALNVPDGATTGDLLLAHIAYTVTPKVSVSAPSGSGWTLVLNGAGSGANKAGEAIYSKIVLAGETLPSSYSFTVYSGSPYGQSVGSMTRYSGVHRVAPVAETTALATGSGTSLATNLLTAFTDSVVVGFFSAESHVTLTVTAPALSAAAVTQATGGPALLTAYQTGTGISQQIQASSGSTSTPWVGELIELNVNHPPTTTNDGPYTTQEDTALTVNDSALGVRGNDTDDDTGTNALTVDTTAVTLPANGTLTLNSNGTFTYVPNGNWNGRDSFVYRVSDGVNWSQATATINVTAVDDPPEGPAGNEMTPQGLAGGQANDVILLGSDPDGGDLYFIITSLPGEGTLETKDATPVVLQQTDLPYHLAVNTRTIVYRAPNEGATTSFTYRISDQAPVGDAESRATARGSASEGRELQGETDSITVWLNAPAGGPTYATVTGFAAAMDDGHVVATWQADEMGTAGWYLERRQPQSGKWTAVNRTLLPALLGAPIGGSYAVMDKAAGGLRTQTYRLREVELGGTVNVYGPYTVRPSGHKLSRQLAEALARGATTARLALATSRTSASTPAPIRNAAAAATNRLRLEIGASGLYGVTSAAVANAFGLTARNAALYISGNRLALTCQGKAVATMAAPDGSALYFWGEALHTGTTDHNVYWLTQGTGTRMASARAVSGTGTARTTFPETLAFERDLLPATALFTDPTADFWLWDYVVAGDKTLGTKQFSLDTPDALTASGGTLAVSLRGLTASGKGDEHHVQVRLNGSLLGEARWQGTNAKQASYAVPAGLLLSGANTLTLTAVLDGGIPYSLVALDSATLSCERASCAVSDQLVLRTAATATLRVDGLSGPAAVVLDLATPRTPQLVKTTSSGTTAGAAWVSFRAATGRDYAVVRAAKALAPRARVVAAGTLRTAGFGADYLIVTHDSLAAAAGDLAAYRAGQGLTTAVVTVQQIADEFADGLPGPQGLKAFLSYVHANWKPAPRYVALTGEGSYDYRNIKGTNDCLVPPAIVGTEYGLAPSDVALADSNGDGVAEVALGRIPAASAATLTAYLDKLKAYEAAAAADWQAKALFVADNADPDAGDFPADADALAGLVPTLTAEKLYYRTEPTKSLTAAQLKARLLAGLGEGKLLFTYVGHGSVSRLAGENLLSPSDTSALANSPRLPVFTAFTCVVGDYGMPGVDSLAETLVKQTGGGAIASVAPTALEDTRGSMLLARHLLPAAFAAGGAERLGAVLQGAAAGAAADGASLATLTTYTLLGDPALVLQHTD